MKTTMSKQGDRDVLLSISHLSKSFGEVAAVCDLSLRVNRGEILGFLGPNGAGKTTTISMVCGLLKCDAGEIHIEGRSLSEEPRLCRRLMGLCPQNLVIWEGLTCREQLEYMGQLYDRDRAQARRRAQELLTIFGLTEKKHQLAKTLSGGMKRRLNIALALVHDPPLLILDEPQAGLDPQSRLLVRDHIRSLAPQTTVILTTHEMDEAERLSDRVAIIDHGRLLELDTPVNLKNRIGEGDVLEITIGPGQESKRQRLRRAFTGPLRTLVAYQGDTLRLVGQGMAQRLPDVLAKLRRFRLKPAGIVIRQKSLEDVFISLTGRGLRE